MGATEGEAPPRSPDQHEERDQNRLFVRITTARDLRTLGEAAEVISGVQQAWRTVWAFERCYDVLDEVLWGKDDAAALQRLVDAVSEFEADLLRPAAPDDPSVTLSMQSPLWMELAEVGAGGGAAWAFFAYVLKHADELARLPYRFRAQWWIGRAEADDARTEALVSNARRRLADLEIAQATSLKELGETLERLGPLEVQSNVEPSVVRVTGAASVDPAEASRPSAGTPKSGRRARAAAGAASSGRRRWVVRVLNEPVRVEGAGERSRDGD
ncbi:hypothetical protein [Pimelobacter sp. 30-1]|uniref:hypothetical protein n=1 Tax=Pimelobacter sp. 30-1 TaxID=2004991 RepID=UPI001C040D4A|nr:hypothetical protein [Pimelobacter sp. 30-1]MBU2698910.1 hypothetical protein [Pimelobacter sp. 30-1]